MQNLYKIEVFSRDFVFKDFAIIENKTIEYDYLSMTNSNITCKKINVQQGDFAIISSDNNDEPRFYGIIDNLYPDERLSIQIKPLIALFDVKYLTSNFSETGYIEDDIAQIITQLFINTSDESQKINGLNIQLSTHTEGNLIFNKNIINFYEIITNTLKTFNIAINTDINVNLGKINVNIGKVNGVVNIETDLKNVLNKKLIIGSFYGSTNKEIVINKNNISQTKEFYLHPDGTVDDIDEDRITPVFFNYKEITLGQTETFNNKALSQAISDLTPTNFNNEIEIDVLKNSKVFDTSIKYGQEAIIHNKGIQYRSILTGKKWNDNYITFIFGCIRTSLTQQLILERRKNEFNN